MSQRAVVSRPANVRFLLEDDAGSILVADSAPHVTVRDPDGVAVSDGFAEQDGDAYRYAFSPPAMGTLTASWTAEVDGEAYIGTEALRVVGRRAVSPSRLRTVPELSLLSAADFVDTVGGAESALETALRFAIVPSVDRITMRVDRPKRLLRPGPNYLRGVVSVTLDGNPIDPALVGIENDALSLPSAGSWDFLTGGAATGTWQTGEYVFMLEHGLSAASSDIQNAVMILARHFAPTPAINAFPDRASKIVSAETEIWFSRRGPGTYFGIPEVDDVVSSLGLDLPIAEV